MDQGVALERLTGHRTAPDGSRFTGGPIQDIHEIGPYAIVEYRDDRRRLPVADQAGHGRTLFHVYVNGADSHRGYFSLDEALLGAIALRNEGANTRADLYAARLLGVETQERADG